MYYVNRSQIHERLDAIPAISEALQNMASAWTGSLLEGLAQERALHLAIEIVTDVGSCLIDGFILRDASSYEDIIEIVGEAGAFPPHIQGDLLELVKLRKPLVQQYTSWQREELHSLSARLPHILHEFGDAVRAYLVQELGAEPS